jgi:hypothetical protein|tara:strand:+ start:326 stop:706 length:381 start_codon:yes stop_codon:yes gene_type:complete
MSNPTEEPIKKKKAGNPALYKGMSSLNPNGRPKGSLNKFTQLSRELMTNKGPEIVNKVIELALEGDRHCLKMCLDRIIPTTKAVEIKHDHQDLGINIIVESVKAIEKREAAEFKTIEAEYKESEDE